MLTLYDFVAESNKIEGYFSVAQSEVDAHIDFLAEDVTVESLELFVRRVAGPRAVLRTKPGQNVRVGSHIAPPGGPDVPRDLGLILLGKDAHRVHLEYLTLHPFMDGNGRSARALWLKMHGRIPSLGFLHTFYYQTLGAHDDRRLPNYR